MAVSHLVKTSILPLDNSYSEKLDDSTPSPNSRNSFSNSLEQGAQAQQIELRRRRPTPSKDVADPRLSSLSSSRETPNHVPKCDPSSRTTTTAAAATFERELNGEPFSVTQQPPTKRLRFERDKIFRVTPNLTIYLVGDTGLGPKIAQYHAKISDFTPKTPDIVLRRARPGLNDGSENDLAVAYFRWSYHVRMGFYGRSRCTSVLDEPQTWEELRNVSRWCLHYKYQFQYDLGDENDEIGSLLGKHNDVNDNEPVLDGRCTFVWQRTRSPEDGVTTFFQKLLMMSYRLIDVRSGQRLATFASPHFADLKSRGELTLYGKFSTTLEDAIVLSIASINEKACRRRVWANRGITAGP